MSLPPAHDHRHDKDGRFSQGENDKHQLRRSLLNARIELDPATRNQWDAAIAERLLPLLHERQATSLGVYSPIRNEPDLHAMYEQLSQQGVKLALPLVTARDAPLEFAAWQPGDPMVEEAMGILVPRNKMPVKLPEMLLAPCVGFNAARYRLGYGGGFFDRTLASATPRPFAIGVAYSFQETSFSVDDFDVPLDCIVTESRILR